MKNKDAKIAAKVTAAATILAMFAMVNPALAQGTPSTMKDTMSREKVSVTGVTHAVSMVMPVAETGTLLITYTAASGSFANFASITSPTCSTSGTAVNLATGTNIVSLTLSACLGTLTFGFTGDNASGVGAVTASLGGTAGLTGSYGVPLVTDDQITVTASVSPTITFDVGADLVGVACDAAWTSSTHTVALGVLTPSAVAGSDTNVAIQHICTKVSTNGTGGVVVTVKSSNIGLKSTSTPADIINSDSSTIAAGAEHYGMCATATHGMSVTVPVGNAPTSTGFTAATCIGAAGDNVTAFTGAVQSAWTTAGPVSNGYYKFDIDAAISGTTRAHSDYTDTLTWIATGTF